jgi:hypothetical protein
VFDYGPAPGCYFDVVSHNSDDLKLNISPQRYNEKVITPNILQGIYECTQKTPEIMRKKLRKLYSVTK